MAMGSMRERTTGRASVTRSARLALMGAAFVALTAAATAFGAVAQQAAPFGGFKHDASQPIEIEAERLEVRNADQVAVFSGDVVVIQGVMRLSTDELRVFYADGGVQGGRGGINRLEAIGSVVMSNGEEAAEANRADYDVALGEILLSGDVMLAQGDNFVLGQKLRIDLVTGVGRIEGGRVRTSVTPASAQQASPE